MLKRGLLFILILILASCKSGDFDSIKGRSFEIQKTKFSRLNDWDDDDFELFDKAIKTVCESILKNPNKKLKSDKIEYSLSEYKYHCSKIIKMDDEDDIKEYVEDNFIPYGVYTWGNNIGKFTSYYEAEIRASYNKEDEYIYPIYGRPDDLVEVNLRDFDVTLPNQRLLGRVKDGKLVKYYTRSEIENSDFNAPVVLWGDSLVDIYLMQIQGAAVATLPNGEQIRVGYADNNGHKFKGIGSILLDKGLIKPQDASMPKIRKWLEKNGKKAIANMQLNDRFIFHKIVDAEGPLGAMGLPLTAGRSVAVDKSYIPLGSILWLETTSPNGKDINKAVIAMDVGSAIKGAVRGDYFWGHGEEAFEYAGKMNSKGKYYLLIPKDAEIVVYDR